MLQRREDAQITLTSPNKLLPAFERAGKPRKEFDRVMCGRRPEAEGMGNGVKIAQRFSAG